MKIILIGFMGAGKTSVANVLSKRLALKKIEMDELVIKKSRRKNIMEIFSKEGETRFRELEIEVAKDLKRSQNVVISTGGGIVLNKIIIDFLKEKGGKTIFLKTSFKSILARLKNDIDRPLFKDRQKAKKLFKFRQTLYQEYADLISLTDDQTVIQIVNNLIKQL